MGRFSSPQDPLFQRLNSSVAFDYRLAPYDLEQSGAHARMLAARDIISSEDLEAIERGLAAIRQEIDQDTFQVMPGDERSEEHTSELQSRQYLVCRLLLEKKKQLII